LPLDDPADLVRDPFEYQEGIAMSVDRQQHDCNEGWICEARPDGGWPYDDCDGWDAVPDLSAWR